MAGRVTRAVIDVESQFTHCHLVAVFQPAIGLENFSFKAPFLAIIFQPRNPEAVGFLRSFNRHTQFFGQNLGLSAMIEMAMGNEQFLDRHAHLFGRCLELVEIAAGIGKGAAHGFGAPDEGAVVGDEGDEARAAGLEAPDEILEQVLQVCEQDMDATCGAVAALRREAVLVSKRKREEELDCQPVRHSLWEQGSLEAYNEVLFGNLDCDVEALQQRKAVYDEERRLSDGSDSCWSNTGSDSDRAKIEVDIEPIALEGAVVTVI